MPWVPPPVSDRALAAFAALRTSVPRPLPGAVHGSGRWYQKGSVAAAMTAYRHAGAPIPAGATVRGPAKNVLSVSSHGRTTGIFFRAEADGCSYVFTGGPSMTVTGSGTPLDGEHWLRVGTVPFNTAPDGIGFFCVAAVRRKPWWIIASVGEDDGRANPLCAVGPASEFGTDGSFTRAATAAVGGPAELTRNADGSITAAVTGTAIVVTASVTDGIDLAAAVWFGQDGSARMPLT